MKSVERLMAEHELIERGLSLLEDAIIKIEDGQALPDGFPEWVVRFFQQFADQCHHAKEEDVFFPVLKQRGIPEKGGPIGVMLHEHVLGRDCVGRMREASQAQPFDSRKFAEAAKQYVPLLLRQRLAAEALAAAVAAEDQWPHRTRMLFWTPRSTVRSSLMPRNGSDANLQPPRFSSGVRNPRNSWTGAATQLCSGASPDSGKAV